MWVNGTDGMCLGRFGARAVDVHQDTAGQAAGKHCLDCYLRTSDADTDWRRFQAGMLAYHGVTVPDACQPLTAKIAEAQPHEKEE